MRIYKVTNTIDGAFANCLFAIQIGTTAYFFGNGRRKHGIFQLMLFTPRYKNGKWRNTRFALILNIGKKLKVIGQGWKA